MKHSRIARRFLLPLAILSCVLVAARAEAGRGITIKGSDTMVILIQRLSEAYMQANPGRIVQVTGGGSGTGIAALINGTTDVCMASRPMKDEEKRKLRDRFQSMGSEIPVAKDGLSIYVNAENPVKQITLDQLRRLYLGEIMNWKDLGGPDAVITLYGRENSSGTYVFFKDNVLKGKDFAARCQTLPGTAAVVNAVARDKNGVGYGGAAYAKGVRDLGLMAESGKPAILPTAATVRDGSYPLTRYLFLYTRLKPVGDMKNFVDYALSPAGQALTTQVGYFPLN